MNKPVSCMILMVTLFVWQGCASTPSVNDSFFEGTRITRCPFKTNGSHLSAQSSDVSIDLAKDNALAAFNIRYASANEVQNRLHLKLLAACFDGRYHALVGIDENEIKKDFDNASAYVESVLAATSQPSLDALRAILKARRQITGLRIVKEYLDKFNISTPSLPDDRLNKRIRDEAKKLVVKLDLPSDVDPGIASIYKEAVLTAGLKLVGDDHLTSPDLAFEIKVIRDILPTIDRFIYVRLTSLVSLHSQDEQLFESSFAVKGGGLSESQALLNARSNLKSQLSKNFLDLLLGDKE